MAGVSLEELEERSRERGIDLEEVFEALGRVPTLAEARLSDPERDVLGRLGVDPDEASTSVPLAAGIARRAQLERGCLGVAEAARRLGRDPSRVRQMLAGPRRSLLGWHRQGSTREWLLPAFQFEHGLAGTDAWAEVVRALPPADATSPVALVAWLVEPRAHLGGRSRVEVLLADDDGLDRVLAEAPTYAMPA